MYFQENPDLRGFYQQQQKSVDSMYLSYNQKTQCNTTLWGPIYFEKLKYVFNTPLDKSL